MVTKYKSNGHFYYMYYHFKFFIYFLNFLFIVIFFKYIISQLSINFYILEPVCFYFLLQNPQISLFSIINIK